MLITVFAMTRAQPTRPIETPYLYSETKQFNLMQFSFVWCANAEEEHRQRERAKMRS